MKVTRPLLWLALFLLLAVRLPAQVKFNGYLSFEYLKSQKDGFYPAGTFSNLNGGAVVSGVLSGPLSFAAEALFNQNDKFSLHQAYVNLQASNLFSFKIGLFEVPFGRFNRYARPAENETVYRPLPFHFFPYRWSDLGLSWEGNYSFIYYSVYAVNGVSADENGYLEAPAKDINKNKGVGGRLAFRLGEGFEAGGSFYSGKYDETNSKNIRFEGFDLIWVTIGWEVKGEYVRTEVKHPFLNQTLDFDGYYFTLVMFFNRFKPYFSYQYSMLPDSRLDDEHALPFNVLIESMVKKDRKAIGFKWDFLDNFYAKFEFDWNKEKSLDKESQLKDNGYSIQLGFVF
ncbi:MAG TPA: hypothetical protein PLW30_08400 [Candidatus Saccharicenans sp.]|nr:hypothetical protein [Candidatus Saccharicenans sp.]HQI23150.1 hypothetical protein [Candidatus Saccharicenans sp.]